MATSMSSLRFLSFLLTSLLAQAVLGTPYYGPNPYFMPPMAPSRQQLQQRLFGRSGPMPFYDYMLDPRANVPPGSMFALPTAAAEKNLHPRQSTTTTQVELTPDEQAAYSQLEKQLVVHDTPQLSAQGRADDQQQPQQQQVASSEQLHAAGASSSAAIMNSLGQQFDNALGNLAPPTTTSAATEQSTSSSTSTTTTTTTTTTAAPTVASSPSSPSADTSMSASEATASAEAQNQQLGAQQQQESTTSSSSTTTASATASTTATAASGELGANLAASAGQQQLATGANQQQQTANDNVPAQSAADTAAAPAAAAAAGEAGGAADAAQPASRDASSSSSSSSSGSASASSVTTTIEMNGNSVLSVQSGTGGAGAQATFENGPPVTAAGPLAAIDVAQIFAGLNTRELEEMEKPYGTPDKDQRIDEDVVMLPVIVEDRSGASQEFDHRYPDENRNNVVNTNKEIHTYTVQKKRVNVHNDILHRHHKVINVNTDYVLNVRRVAHPHAVTETFVQTQVRHKPFIYVKHTRTDRVNDVGKTIEMPTEEVNQTATELPAVFDRAVIRRINYDQTSGQAVVSNESPAPASRAGGQGAAGAAAEAAPTAAAAAPAQDAAAAAAAPTGNDAGGSQRKKRNFSFFKPSRPVTKSGELINNAGFANPVVIQYRKM